MRCKSGIGAHNAGVLQLLRTARGVGVARADIHLHDIGALIILTNADIVGHHACLMKAATVFDSYVQELWHCSAQRLKRQLLTGSTCREDKSKVLAVGSTLLSLSFTLSTA